jgi:HEAT repeat protein
MSENPIMHRPFLLSAVILFLALVGVQADEATQADEQTLQAVGLRADGPTLLDFFHKRTAGEVKPERLTELVRQLSDKSAPVREKATGDLVALGTIALPWLRAAAKDPDDLETAERARKCMEQIQGSAGSTLVTAAARLLAQRAPAGATEALLAFLPFADDDTVVEEVKASLATLSYRGGKPDPVLTKALEAKSSLARAIAAEALCQPGEDPLPEVRKLLKDPKPTVRLRVALALAEFKDADAISELIGLIGELPVVQGRQGEEYLATLAGDAAPKVPLNDDASRAKCRDAWAAWWKKSEGNVPLEDIRRRTLNEATRDKATALLKKLGDESFAVRETAQNELKALGVAIIPILRQHSRDPDPEISARCRKTLEELEKEKAMPISVVAIRLVALRKPAGSAEALLAYMPSAEDELISAEVQAALNAVPLRDGKPDPVLLKALDDPTAMRRAAAGEALCHAGAEGRAAVHKLLKDADGTVRLRVALALASTRDKAAVPTLIDCLADMPLEQASQAEALLRQTAGDAAPKEMLGADAESRKKVREAWAAWWKANSGSVELARINTSKRMLGYTLICLANNGRVMEIGLDGKERWHIDGLNNPWDAHVLSGDRVLIAEFNGGRVTERNFKGDVLWERAAPNPIACQRLPNGNTFIVCRNQLQEVTRDGKEVFKHDRPDYSIMGAQKLRNGKVIFFTNNGTAHRLDASGKEEKSFNVGQFGQMWGGGGDVLANGNVVAPQWNSSKVIEYDQDGKQLWEAGVQWPHSAVRLPNGNTLVSSQNTNKITEINKAGKVVWEHQCSNGQPFRVRRR